MRGNHFIGKMTVSLAVILALFMAAGVAGEDRTDASGQWTYVLDGGGATITWMTTEEPAGDLVIPGELDGYAVTGIGKYAFAESEGLTSVPLSPATLQAFYCMSASRRVLCRPRRIAAGFVR